MDRNDTPTSITNPQPVRTVKRGMGLCAYDAKTSSIIEGTAELITGDSVILRTKDGLRSYWKKELWEDRAALEHEIDARFHPVREAAIASIKDIPGLIAFCIEHNFRTDEHASDLRQTVSVRCSDLLGFDPFDPSACKEEAIV